MKFAIGLIALFTIGGISGVMHSSPPADLQQTDTYFIVAHFHYVLFGGSIMGIFGGIYYYFPKITGRYMDEKLGTWHFWSTFISMNLTFFPMHFSGMLGMPRRIYTYDAGQGWDTFNMMSSVGAGLLILSTLIFVVNFLKSRTSGAVAPGDAWGAGTLEWSIPSPPPDYNYAEIPLVTSRYPLWDVTHPERTSGIVHSSPDAGTVADAHATAVHEEKGHKTAAELGIPMPFNTVKPAIAALAIVMMFGGLLFMHTNQFAVAMTITIGSACLFVGTLYAWLTSPLE
jgi:cytochrome c oxidase subunit I